MCVVEIASLAREAALDAAWRQWAALGAPAYSPDPAARAVIDPEALLLVSASLRASERRLDDALAWCAAESTLLSVQRTSSLLRTFPASAKPGVAAFAAEAVKAGDGRWSALAKGRSDELDLMPRGKRGSEPRLAEWPALMLRLRAGFGVGLKADLLALLLAMNGQDATIQTLTKAAGYTSAAVRRAAHEMDAANFVRHGQRRPVAYHVDGAAWSAVLLTAPAEETGWRWFAQVFAFLAWTSAWGEEQRESPPYIAATTARDVADANQLAFEQNRIDLATSAAVRGERYLEDFGDAVQAMAAWLGQNL